MSPGAVKSGQAGEGNKEVGFKSPLGSGAEYMEAIPYLQLFQLAQIIVYLGQCLGVGVSARDADVLVEAD